MKYIIWGFIWSVFVNLSFAANFYIDPENGNDQNPGSIDMPWKTIQHPFNANLIESQKWNSLPYTENSKLIARNPGAVIKPGDTIWLLNGYYGSLFIQEYYNADNITIAAMNGHIPSFRGIHIQAGANWTIKGLHFCPEFGSGKLPRDLIRIESHGHRGPVTDITVEDCVVFSALDISKWSKEDWNTLTCNGISAGGTRITIRNNRIKNVNFGISVSASHSFIDHNIIENFAGDGLRGLGDYCVFQYNTVKNCYEVNDNHDDGFQSWSRTKEGVGKGEVIGVTLRGNTFINFEDRAQPFRGTLQGIGCFDGMFVDWIIENNVVIVDHWHGITLLGAKNCRIVNNTVIDQVPGKPGPTWIQIGNHKDGRRSSGCVIRNNLSTAIKPASGRNMVMDHNIIVVDYDAVFNNVKKFDLSLKGECNAIDSGSADLVPTKDIVGIHRPQGSAIDIGAYEFLK